MINDGTMVRLLQLLLEVADAPDFELLDAPRRASARKAFERGVACLLDCQIRVEGRLTIRCAQHDWFKASTTAGLRLERRDGNRQAVADPDAPALWGRFYEIKTNRPLFASRDGVPRYDFNEIEAQRRNGYAWFGNWGEAVAKDYQQWAK